MNNNEPELTKQPLIGKKWYFSIFGFAALFGMAGGVWGASIFAARAHTIPKVQPTAEIVVPATGLVFKTAEGKT